MLKDAQGFGFYEESFHRSAEGLEGGFPMDLVANENSALGLFEGVAVVPKAIRSKALFVHEGVAFVDGLDFGDPGDGEEGGDLKAMDDDGARVDGAVGTAWWWRSRGRRG